MWSKRLLHYHSSHDGIVTAGSLRPWCHVIKKAITLSFQSWQHCHSRFLEAMMPCDQKGYYIIIPVMTALSQQVPWGHDAMWSKRLLHYHSSHDSIVTAGSSRPWCHVIKKAITLSFQSWRHCHSRFLEAMMPCDQKGYYIIIPVMTALSQQVPWGHDAMWSKRLLHYHSSHDSIVTAGSLRPWCHVIKKAITLSFQSWQHCHSRFLEAMMTCDQKGYYIIIPVMTALTQQVPWGHDAMWSQRLLHYHSSHDSIVTAGSLRPWWHVIKKAITLSFQSWQHCHSRFLEAMMPCDQKGYYIIIPVMTALSQQVPCGHDDMWLKRLLHYHSSHDGIVTACGCKPRCCHDIICIDVRAVVLYIKLFICPGSSTNV